MAVPSPPSRSYAKTGASNLYDGATPTKTSSRTRFGERSPSSDAGRKLELCTHVCGPFIRALKNSEDEREPKHYPHAENHTPTILARRGRGRRGRAAALRTRLRDSAATILLRRHRRGPRGPRGRARAEECGLGRDGRRGAEAQGRG